MIYLDGVRFGQRQAGFTILALWAKTLMNVRAICPIDMTTLGSVGKWTVTAQGVNTLAVVGAVGIIQAKIDLLVAIDEADNRCAW